MDPYRVPIEQLTAALERAPLISETSTRKRPKKYKDISNEYDSSLREEQLVEYPYSPGMADFKYANQTNNHEMDEANGVIPGYGRIIATEDKRLRGYSVHPINSRKILDRSPEIRQSRIPGLEKLVEYEKQSYGEGSTKKRGVTGTIYRDPRDSPYRDARGSPYERR